MRVVLPAPGAARTTSRVPRRSAATTSGRSASMGSGCTVALPCLAPAPAANGVAAAPRGRVHTSAVLTFRQFVDDALFHPRWGYYATGAVRFGLGGHYDTYPLALSPLFGRMLAAQARRVWRAGGRPRCFELCEIGAGNGQLAVDVLVSVDERARRHAGWRAFARALRYRIVERSPGLIARQRAHLGPLTERVVWTRADLSEGAPAGAPFARLGLVFGNEVLDCFAPERVVARNGLVR